MLTFWYINFPTSSCLTFHIYFLTAEKIYPIGLEIKKLMDDKKYLDSVLSNGNERAKSKASKTINEIYDIVGFIRTWNTDQNF